jgi:hypothetical protein
MLIRKVSIGPDYKSSAMHYVVGQPVFNEMYRIHDIKEKDGRVSIYVIHGEDGSGEIYLWKTFNQNMAITFEFNLDFE